MLANGGEDGTMTFMQDNTLREVQVRKIDNCFILTYQLGQLYKERMYHTIPELAKGLEKIFTLPVESLSDFNAIPECLDKLEQRI